MGETIFISIDIEEVLILRRDFDIDIRGFL